LDPKPPSPPPPHDSLLAQLRQRVAGGLYPPGARLAEETVAQDLGVSRTPVRLAFRTLAQEGLLRSAGKRGFVVREFTEDDVQCGVEVRGALEGLAARRVAARGLSDALRAQLQACIAEGEATLASVRRGRVGALQVARWAALNSRFHQAIVQAAGSSVIADAIARNNHLPFASADSITVQSDALDAEFEKLRMAQAQHRLVLDALERGEGGRAEALMREHALIGVRYGFLFGLKGRSGGKGLSMP
jgi:GntR family transcriptional regulator, vanillate catabolism transcriptional regulator